MVDLRAREQIGFGNAQAIADKVHRAFPQRRVRCQRRCSISRFRSVIQQIPTAQRIIPAEFERRRATRRRPVYEFEPDEGEILDSLLPRNIAVQIYRALSRMWRPRWAPR